MTRIWQPSISFPTSSLVWYLEKAVCKHGVSQYDELRHRAMELGSDGGGKEKEKEKEKEKMRCNDERWVGYCVCVENKDEDGENGRKSTITVICDLLIC